MTSRPPSGGGDDYIVGFGQPPKHTQFKKGNRANPFGRAARKREELAKAVRETLASKVEIRQGGRRRRVTRSEANVLALFDKAKRGNVSAADRLLDLHGSASKAGEGKTRTVEIHNALPDEEPEDFSKSAFDDNAAPGADLSARNDQ